MIFHYDFHLFIITDQMQYEIFFIIKTNLSSKNVFDIK